MAINALAEITEKQVERLWKMGLLDSEIAQIMGYKSSKKVCAIRHSMEMGSNLEIRRAGMLDTSGNVMTKPEIIARAVLEMNR